MKFIRKVVASILLFMPLIANGQQRECISYAKHDNVVVFIMRDNSALQMKFCSPSIIKIWSSKDGIFKRKNPSFSVINENVETVKGLNVSEQESSYDIYTDYLHLKIKKNPFKLEIYDKYQKLLFGDCHNKECLYNGKHKTEYKVLFKDEHIFGLGEKSGKLDRRGESYKMWNSDKPCYSVTDDPLYKSIPFFMTNYHYGIFLDNTYKTEFKFGTESRDYYSFEVPDGEMIYYFIYGKDYKNIISQYVELIGKPILPPAWAFGFAQSRGLLTNEKLTYEIANGYRKRGIPCDIIYQDIGWTDKLQNFEWNKDSYSSPRKMLSDLKGMGFKVIVSQDPVISKTNVSQWNEADSLGYFLKDNRTQKTYDMPWPWGGDCGLVDFTIPQATDWWGSYQQKAINDGVSGFWTDMGEPAWSNEEETDRLFIKHSKGMHDEMHNVFGLTWNKAVKEQFEKCNPDKRIFQMTRSSFAGMQRYTFGWTGDCGNGDDVLNGWKQMENQIAVTLSDGLGLIPFTTCDISGYCGDIENYDEMAELYTRWVQFGAFNPLSRIHHEGNNAVEPWLFGKEAEKNVKSAIELKYRLFPYIYTLAREAYDNGTPIMRPVFMEFPMDDETFSVDNQFMFGSSILVAPVVKHGATSRNVYLPEGKWINYNDKKTEYSGEQRITVDAPLSIIPMFVKEGSMIPTMPVMNYINEVKDYPIIFDVFTSKTKGKLDYSLYEDDGESLGYQRGEYSLTKVSLQGVNDYVLKINKENHGGYKSSSKHNLIFKIYNVSKPSNIRNEERKFRNVRLENITKSFTVVDNEMLWSWNKEDKTLIIRIPDIENNQCISIKL